MWTMASAIYAGFKWLSYRSALQAGVAASRRRALVYLAAWPGMDAAAFLASARGASAPAVREWRLGALELLAGAALVWGGARLAVSVQPVAAGWMGMAGVILFLHFGAFRLLSAGWRRAGIDAAPVMRAPLRSRSLAEFWAERWNTPFHQLAREFIYRPLCAVCTRSQARLLVFVISGLAHELVVSLPAGAGYGLPAAYFLLQGIGLEIERSAMGRRLGLGRGVRGRAFALAVAGPPVVLLFHPPFVREVILPFLDAIAAL